MDSVNRAEVREFLLSYIDDLDIKIPRGIKKEELVETFYQYLMTDYHDWLSSNAHSFFENSWEEIKDMGKRYRILNRGERFSNLEGHT